MCCVRGCVSCVECVFVLVLVRVVFVFVCVLVVVVVCARGFARGCFLHF